MTTQTTAISLENITKTYRGYSSLLDRFREVLHRRPHHAIHTTLDNISLSVQRGETLGLVGENGAGKSTLLKLIAGTILPSAGRITIEGRVAALLELGAGFHPEENGIDNLMMMAALNNIPGEQLSNYLKQVIEFSELPEDALQRPVKTYSSGMFMRLAFASATAIDPDVLVIDEALSVGDMHFQKKSLDRIMRFKKAGKTILFCSHNLYQVRSLCDKVAWIHNGRIHAYGNPEDIITDYESHERLKSLPAQNTAELSPPPCSDDRPARIVNISLETSDGINPAYIETFQSLRLVIEIESYTDDTPFHIGAAIVRNDKENIFGTSTHFKHADTPLHGRGKKIVALHLPSLPLLSGDYQLSIYLLDNTGLHVIDTAEGIRPFRVLHREQEFGLVHIAHHWEGIAP